MTPHLFERAQRVPHALHSTGMDGGPLRQQGDEVMPHSGFMHGPSTRARGPLRAPVGRPPAAPPAPGSRVRGIRQRLAGRAGRPASMPSAAEQQQMSGGSVTSGCSGSAFECCSTLHFGSDGLWQQQLPRTCAQGSWPRQGILCHVA